jgi:hypothetical protein
MHASGGWFGAAYWGVTVLFLSYAREDSQVGREIAYWLGSHGFPCNDWQAPQQNSRFIERIENDINNAEVFFAFLSPDYIASPWCRFERELALQRDVALRQADPSRSFVQVLEIAKVPPLSAGFLSSYGRVDLTDPANRDSVLNTLIATLGLPPPGSAETERTTPGPAITMFRNRHDELQKVKHGLTNAGGPHFWLLNAPPELGKTWFLGRLSGELVTAEPDRWVVRLVDLREQSTKMLVNVGEILACLLRLPSIPDGETETLQDLARVIIRGGKSYLCLLDGAELLPDETAIALRRQLGRIYEFVQEAGDINVRVALVVASRRDDKWRGVAPYPRLDSLSLSEFSVNVVVHALFSMAGQMNRTFDQAVLRRHGELAHRLSEGLPALLVRCLQWIRHAQWLGMDRLASQELFEELAGPYIEQKLLSRDSLMPGIEKPPGAASAALGKALRALVPYRFFTQSHLRHYVDTDANFQQITNYLEWSLDDLWNIVSRTALLKRPMDEPWQEIHAAIRRLLFRFYYRTAEERVAAHHDAREFVKVWADQQSWAEQIKGMVDCLWHEAEVLRLTESSETARVLSESARKFSQGIQPSTAYTKHELQVYAARRMMEDKEFQESTRHVDGLIDTLVEIVVTA